LLARIIATSKARSTTNDHEADTDRDSIGG